MPCKKKLPKMNKASKRIVRKVDAYFDSEERKMKKHRKGKVPKDNVIY